MYKNIAIAIDLDEKTEEILEKSLEIAKIHQAKVTIFHVAQVMILDSSYDLLNTEVIIPDDNDEYKKFLHEKAIVFKNENLTATSKIYKGTNIVSTIINDVYEDLCYDLLICGANNKKGISDFILGSVSSKLATESKTDILIVK